MSDDRTVLVEKGADRDLVREAAAFAERHDEA